MARGRVRSRKKEEIFEEINNLANQGYKEVVITGIHLSSYGLDFYPDEKGKVTSYNSAAGSGEYTNKDLLEVIDRVSEIEGIKRIRLGSLEPRIITREFLERISKNGKICPHFHLSLQSGCDETLKRMNRQYTTEEFYEKTCLIREYFDKPAITTDIITGFPGENSEEFEETYDFVKIPYHGNFQKQLDDLLESITPTYAVITSSEEEIDEWPILKFQRRSESYQRILSYVICGVGECSGTTWKDGNPTPHPFFGRLKNGNGVLSEMGGSADGTSPAPPEPAKELRDITSNLS